MTPTIRRAAWALAVVPVLLLAACSSPSVTLRLSITADPDVGALTALTAHVLVGDGDAARVASLEVPFEPARDLVADPYVLQIDVPEGSPFATTARVFVAGRNGGKSAGSWAGEHDLTVVETIEVSLAAIDSGCDADGDGFKNCGGTGCCGPAEKGWAEDCDDAQAKEQPFADQPACRDCRDADSDGVADCLQAPTEPSPELAVEPSPDASDALHDAVDADSSHDAPDADATADVSDADLETADVPDAPDPSEAEGSDVDASDPGQDHDALLDAVETEIEADSDTTDSDASETCTPDCTGKPCGDDGCGGSCGTCGGGQTCSASGQCVGDALTPGFVKIPAGSFWMGSPAGQACPSGYTGGGCPGSGTAATELGRLTNETLHQVKLTTAFELQAHELTQGEWKAVYPSWNPSYHSSCGDTCPVEMVSWYDVVAVANARSVAAELTPCYALAGITCEDGTGVSAAADCMTEARGGIGVATVTLNGVATPYACTGFRLPTEAEWEYAYRAGGVTAFYTSAGNDGTITKTSCSLDPNLDQIGWYCGNDNTAIMPGGGKEANALGLVDMAGNAWEWCWDWLATFNTLATLDPTGGVGSARVVRGGAWSHGVAEARAAMRFSGLPGARTSSFGARLARSLP